MYSSDMILHVINPAKYPFASFPGTCHARFMFGLMPIAIFLARETSLGRLSAAFMTAKKGLGVTAKMLAEIATPSEYCLGSTPRVCASPATAIWQGIAKIVQLCWVGG